MKIYNNESSVNETCPECYAREAISYSKLKHYKIYLISNLKDLFTPIIEIYKKNKLLYLTSIIIDIALSFFAITFPLLVTPRILQLSKIANTLVFSYLYYTNSVVRKLAYSDHNELNIQNEPVVAVLQGMSLPCTLVIKQIEKSKRVIKKEWNTIHDIEQAVSSICKQNNRIEELWISSHGSKWHIASDEEPIDEYNVEKLRPIFSKLSPNATIVLLTCGAAGEVSNNLNIAQRIVEVAQGRVVIAASQSISNANVIYKEHATAFKITTWKSTQKPIHKAFYLLEPLINILPDVINPFTKLDVTTKYQLRELHHSPLHKLMTQLQNIWLGTVAA